MDKRRFLMVAGMLGGLALLAAACAPAAEPAPTTTTGQQQTTTETKPAAAKPAETKPAAKPAETKPAAAKPAETKPAAAKPAAEAKPTTSVSGVPLDPNAKFGGILRNVNWSEGPTFSPWEEAAGIPFRVQHPVTNMLVRTRTWGTLEDFQKGAFQDLVPDLATEWEQSADGLRWIFKLREGVKWSDGTPFTCADAKWSFDTIRTGEGLRRSPRAVHFLAVSDIQCPDDLTMVMTMKRAKPGLINMIAMPYHNIFPKHRFENNTDALRNEKPSIGTGPFTLKEWVPGEVYRFVRKADYWNQPFPYLDGIEMRIIAASAAQATALRAGRLDLGASYGFTGGPADTLLKECKDCQTWPPVVNVDYDFTLNINHQRPPWNQREVMDAISLALDRPRIAQVVGGGWMIPAIYGPFQPDTYWAMPYDRVKQVPGYNLETPAENKQRARELLAQAGYKPGELKLDLEVWSIMMVSIPPVVEDLAAVGIEVKPYALESASHYNAMSAGDFDIGVHGFWLAGVDPDVPLYEHFYTGSDRNYGRYSNPEVDRLIDQVSATVDRELRRQRAWDVGEIVLREHGKINLVHTKYQMIYGPRLRGMMPSNATFQAYGPWNAYEHAWLVD